MLIDICLGYFELVVWFIVGWCACFLRLRLNFVVCLVVSLLLGLMFGFTVCIVVSLITSVCCLIWLCVYDVARLVWLFGLFG